VRFDTAAIAEATSIADNCKRLDPAVAAKLDACPDGGAEGHRDPAGPPGTASHSGRRVNAPGLGCLRVPLAEHLRKRAVGIPYDDAARGPAPNRPEIRTEQDRARARALKILEIPS
jgi:hypothetical protein